MVTHSDTGNDSEVKIPPHMPYIGDYCKTCISKWLMCICKPSSDWDENPINIMQTDNPSKKENNNNDKHPLPSDWSEEENFWNGKDYEKTRPKKPRYRHFPCPKRDSEESDWNENLYPHCYRDKVQLQVPLKQPPPGWVNWRKKQSLPTGTENNKVSKEDENGKTRDNEVYLEQVDNISNEIMINNAKTISQEEFNNIN